MQMNKTLFIGAAIGSVIVYLLMKDKKQKCPPCESNDRPAPATLLPSYPTVVVQPTPSPAPPPPPPPPPPPKTATVIEVTLQGTVQLPATAAPLQATGPANVTS